MAFATAATFAGIHNENEFYSHHYLSEIFTGDIKDTVKRWQEEATGGRDVGASTGSADANSRTATPPASLRALGSDYTRFREGFARRAGWRAVHQLHSERIAEQCR